MAHERIFEHTDGDGDAIRVLSRAVTDNASLILRNEANDGLGSVPVRMYPEEVWSLIEALVSWYAVNGSRDITLTASPQTVGTQTCTEPEPVSERCTVCKSAYGRQCVKDDGHSDTHEYDQPEDIQPAGKHDDPALRLEALRLAVQRSAGMDLSRQAVMDIAREFEAYLWGVELKASDPDDALCDACGHVHLPNTHTCGYRPSWYLSGMECPCKRETL